MKELSKNEQKVFDDIEQYGCHIINVFEGEDSPSFSYSLGIYANTGKPDLIVTGLNQDLAQYIINEYNLRLRNGEHFDIDEF